MLRIAPQPPPKNKIKPSEPCGQKGAYVALASLDLLAVEGGERRRWLERRRRGRLSRAGGRARRRGRRWCRRRGGGRRCPCRRRGASAARRGLPPHPVLSLPRPHLLSTRAD